MIEKLETSIAQTKKNLSPNLKKTLKQKHHGSGLGNPVKTFDKITSSVSNFADKLSNLLLGGPPDVHITSIPYTDIYGDKDSNMTIANRDAFLKDIGPSQHGNLFRKRLEAYEEENITPSEWKYNITKGQLKNYAENFCQERKDLFDKPEDPEKKKMFNLPDDNVVFDKPKKCEKMMVIGSDEEEDSEKEDYEEGSEPED